MNDGVLEVMGRNAGWIAVNCGIAGGAEAIILPEEEFNIDEDIILPIVQGRNRGKKHYLVIVAEGIGGAVDISQIYRRKTQIVTRATILGYIQRGGLPTVRQSNGQPHGAHAVNCLLEGKRIV